MSLTVNDVTACLDSCSNSSSAPESSSASPPSTLVTLPLRLLSIRESIEKRSLPCMVLSTPQCLNNARRECFAPCRFKRAFTELRNLLPYPIGGGLKSVSIHKLSSVWRYNRSHCR